MSLLERARAIKAAREKYLRPEPDYSELRDWIWRQLLEFHGINGIAVEDKDTLRKNFKTIACVHVSTTGLISITVYRDGKPYSLTTDNLDSFVEALVEGMSYHV